MGMLLRVKTRAKSDIEEKFMASFGAFNSSCSFKIILRFVSKRIANILVKGHVCALKTFWSARFLFFRLSIASQLLLLRGARSCAATAYSAATRVQLAGV